SRTAGRQTANRWPAGWTACPSAPDRRRYASAAAGPAGRHHAAAPPVDVRRCASSSAVSPAAPRSEEHTSELQSRENLVCRLLLDTATTEIYTLSLHDALPI